MMTVPKKASFPPFRADKDMKCPSCGDSGCVQISDQDVYYEGEEVNANCSGCNALLVVEAAVKVSFSNVAVDGCPAR